MLRHEVGSPYPVGYRGQTEAGADQYRLRAAEAVFKAEQEKRRREEALVQATELRVLSAIAKAMPDRLMKRDLMFVAERLAAMLDDKRQAIVIRQHGIGKTKGSAADGSAKLLTAFVHKADESILGRLMVEDGHSPGRP
jgi:ParB family chromosome partitioning protein